MLYEVITQGSYYTVPGIYSAAYSSETGCDSIYTFNLTVNTLPVVSISSPDSIWCIDWSPAALSGTPSGGVFSGQGMTDSIFDPGAAGTGIWPVIYTYTDVNGCSRNNFV